jgi:AraC-like DNA-binding protein
MMEIYYDSVDYSDFLNTVARSFRTRPAGGILTIPSSVGVGYMKATTLPNGMSVLVSDCRFREDMVFHRNSRVGSDFYVLQFNEAVEAPVLYSTGRSDAYNLLKKMVLLTCGGNASKFFVPANSRMISYRVIFQRKHLLEYIDEQALDQFMDSYFCHAAQMCAIEPLDVEYRALLNELTKQAITHPLGVNFMQNRTLLLIEKFFVKFMTQQKAKPEQDKLRFSDQEMVRLMKIESMLVNDFSVTPPNINYLSRISAMSPTKLKTDFKRLYGVPIYEYYQKNRMQRAKNLLLEGKHSIKEVGIKVGYSNLSHFAGSFKKEFGILPSEMLAKDGALAI